MTTETTATPATDMLIKPRMTPDPSPLRVSTFVQPEYAKLMFQYGKGIGVTWPIHCRKFIVKIPTGSHGGALTAEPALIRYDLTVTEGHRAWRVDKDDRDPNQVIFTCLPPLDETGVFDGTWQIKLELWGIEVNGGVGPVGITFEEETSRTGNANDWAVRTGRGEVSKRDDSFFLHSFRPATTVTGYNTSVQLTWVGTADAIYTVSYRDAGGVNRSVPASGGTWPSPQLKHHTDFVLKASKGGQDYYLTTSVEVNNPDIVATSVTATGNISTTAGAISASGNISTTNGTVSGKNVSATNGTVTATGNISTTNGTVSGKNVSATNGTVTATGNISTTAGAISASGNISTTNGTVSGANVTAGGKRVIRHDDVLSLVNASYDQPRYLYREPYGDGVYGSATNQYRNSRWKVAFESTVFSESSTGNEKPDAPANPEPESTDDHE